MVRARLDIAPCPVAATAALEAELGVSCAVAQVLVRRGFGNPDAARRFLSADEEHEPSAFAGMDEATALILRHAREGSPITVHGDYDVDGVCSTAVLVRALRTLGGRVDWYLPDRAEGYGLGLPTVRRLAERGTRLLITADCAITAIDEVAAARAAGMDVVVTDHHSPLSGGPLPDAPIVHPAVGGYPCPHLCATAVAYKLALALTRAAGQPADGVHGDLDLVGLATIADVVPLVGENRTLARRGLRALAVTTKPGLRALMAVARVDSSRIDERAVGFGLCPRINAAGRLYRADAGLELVLTTDRTRAAQIAEELDRANHERRHEETRILFEAEAQVAELGDRPAYVLAGEGWHPGVIGIVASRVAERRHRPVVVVALEGESGRGSGRSIPAFDLLAGLDACAEHLVRHGGHRAAAGLELARERLPEFREAFARHAGGVLGPEDLVAVERVDALVSGDEIGLALAEELTRLAPFGQGNPPVSLLVAAAELGDARTMGEGRHVRFTVRSGGVRAGAVAFGVGGRLPVRDGERADATFTLEVNEYNGAIEPRLVLRQAVPCAPAPITLVGEPAAYLDGVWAELRAALPGAEPELPPDARTVLDRRGRGLAGTLAVLVASGEPALVVCADARLRFRHLRGRAGGFDLCSYSALMRGDLGTDGYTHVALLDPPAYAAADRHAWAGDGFVHLLWGEQEQRFAQRVHERDHDLRAALPALYRSLRSAGSAQGDDLAALLRGASETDAGRPAGLAGRLLRVLAELELVEVDAEAGAVTVHAERPTSLERSPCFGAHARRLAEGRAALGAAARAA